MIRNCIRIEATAGTKIDRIGVIVKKGQRQVIKDFAASQGKSLKKFICDAIEQQMGEKLKSEND